MSLRARNDSASTSCSQPGPTGSSPRSTPGADERFLEIGPGPGALTLRLAPRVAHLTAVELDADMVGLLRPKLPANVTLVQADFLDLDLASVVVDGPFRVAGNLPYNVSSPILFRLLEAHRRIGRLSWTRR